MAAEPDPERLWVQIRRQDLGVLLAVAMAAFDRLGKTHPTARRTWELGQAISAAEQALLSMDTPESPT